MLLAFYSLALLLVLIVGAPYWLLRMATTGKYREGLLERLGVVPRRLRQAVAGRRVVWVHAVSVGEALAASRLIAELGERSGCLVVVSTTTATGQRLARERFGADRVFYFPLDFAFAVRAWLRVLKPEMLVLLETELWPRLLTECRRREIPVCVVNARISDRSWPRYRRLRRLWRPLLAPLTAVLAQTELDAQRLHALGATRAQAVGNLKYDIRIAATLPIVDAVREHRAQHAPVLVCGSTCGVGAENEEQLLLPALPVDAITILAPRHPERFALVADLLEERRKQTGLPWHRRSTWGLEPLPLVAGSVLLLDSIGELASLYQLATVAFVGGSLVAAGGHNPLEPAQFGVPVVMGPYYQNFRGIVDALSQQQALRLCAVDALGATLREIIDSPAEAEKMGERGRVVCQREAGTTERVALKLLALLASASPASVSRASASSEAVR